MTVLVCCGPFDRRLRLAIGVSSNFKDDPAYIQLRGGEKFVASAILAEEWCEPRITSAKTHFFQQQQQ
jgi:hypothetical protein